jgi:mRNA interferase RelE/StbE
MASYELVVRKSVAKDLRRIPNRDIKAIVAIIQSLRTNPRPTGVQKLSGQERYRIRHGCYRIIYEIADVRLIVTVVKVGHRRDVYKR